MAETGKGGRSILGAALIALIRLYQRWISPLTPPSCRFQPTCSSYAIEAITTHGICKGLLKSLWRLLRCHPFSKGGWDPP